MRLASALVPLFLSVGVAIADPAAAQEKPVPQPKQLTISLGQTIRLQMSTKRPIKTVIVDRSDVLRVTPLDDDPTTIMVTGLAPGMARLTLTDVDGKKEVFGPGKPKDAK
ncbi:MAG: pilus assembly protein N-terminal domain-containing protein [Gemmataceae bacterium]|nr:pilus assembly protein N-terminal domain-containing protein [Gemmataceae bacterium]